MYVATGRARLCRLLQRLIIHYAARRQVVEWLIAPPLQPNLVYLTLEIPVQFRLETEEELAFTPFGGVVQCNEPPW